jgi:hypothetical protein
MRTLPLPPSEELAVLHLFRLPHAGWIDAGQVGDGCLHGYSVRSTLLRAPDPSAHAGGSRLRSGRKRPPSTAGSRYCLSVPIPGVNVGGDRFRPGGPWARWWGRLWCVRAPGLISVRDPVFGVGDVMVDGVFPRGDAVRPLGLRRPSVRGRRQQHAGSGPRCIGVRKGCARTVRRGAQAGCRACSPSSRNTWKLRLSSLRASARQALPASRSAAWS